MPLTDSLIDVGQYGTNPVSNVSSTFGDITLEPPTLNITAYLVPSQLNRTLNDLVNPKSDKERFAGLKVVFEAADQLYNQDDVEKNGQCQAQKVCIPIDPFCTTLR